MQQNYDFCSPIFRISHISLNMFWNFLLASLEMDLTRSSGGIGWPYGYQNNIEREHTLSIVHISGPVELPQMLEIDEI